MPKRGSKYQHLFDDPDVGPWISGYNKNTQLAYIREFDRFLKWLKKTPGDVVAERKADLKREDEYERKRYERLVFDFFRLLLKTRGRAKKTVDAAKSFFRFRFGKRGELDFTVHEIKEFGRVGTVYIDYLPTREDLKALVEVADVRDRAILLALASTGICGDIAEFTRPQFEQGIARKASPNDPVCMAPRGGYLKRLKTNVRMRPFLTCDAANAIKLYLKTRRDDAPWLFVERNSKKLSTGALDKIIKRLVGKAALDIPKDQRMRLHNFRDFFSEATHDADIPHDWICVLYGRKISGSEDFYVHASEDKLREKFKRVEPHLSVSRLSNMVLLRKQHEVALDDHERVELEGLKRLVGEEKFRRMAEYELAMQPMIKWNPETEYEPAIYRRQRILGEMLGGKRKQRPRSASGRTIEFSGA